MNIVIIGLSITTSWGNSHATTFRSLVKGLHKRGHNVLFLEKDIPLYSTVRDLPDPTYCRVEYYTSLTRLKEDFFVEVENADMVMVGSYVPEGIAVGKWVINTARGLKAFYDLDATVTISKMRNKTCDYILPKMIPCFDLYLSSSAGHCLTIFECEFGAPDPQPLYCSVETEIYYPVRCKKQWDLGYLGTYSDDRQFALNSLLIKTAKKWGKGRFIVAGPQYPRSISWPENVERVDHLLPNAHREFYNSQRFTLNVTRNAMIMMGYSPNVRLFEAAACGVPIISDYWSGIYTIFKPGNEILISSSPDDTMKYLTEIPEKQRRKIGENARQIVLEKHTGEKRASELEEYIANNRVKQKKKAGYALI